MAEQPTNGGRPDETKRVVLRRLPNHESADLAAAKLQAHGIDCWVEADDAGGMYPNLTLAQGVRLLVQEADVQRAVEVLDAQMSAAELAELEVQATSAQPEPPSRRKLSPVQILLGLLLGIGLCLLWQAMEKPGTKTYYLYTKDGRAYEAFTYKNGRLAEAVRDRNLDGKWDTWSHYEHGHLLRAEYDNNFDGKPDEWWTMSNGSPVSMEKDTDFNGVPDELCTYTNGVPQQIEIKPNGSRFVTQRWLYRNGVLTEIQRGRDTNGNFTIVTHYDPFFNPTNKMPDGPASFHLLTP